MIKVIGKASHKLMGIASALALMLAVVSVSNLCFFWVHQPDVPDGLKKYE